MVLKKGKIESEDETEVNWDKEIDLIDMINDWIKALKDNTDEED